jgi:GT2 family glycosyltransferase
VLANAGDVEIVVVDQSDDDATQSVLAELGTPRVRYVRTGTRGVAAARNLGIRHATGAIIAFTDDDCLVPPDWIEGVMAAFAIDDRIGIVFGNVIARPHDPAVGIIPEYVRSEPALARAIAEQHRTDGMSACMGVRRSVWRAVGGFDELLGAGAPLKSAAEGDFALRALQRGHFVYQTPRWGVLHDGFREWGESRTLIHRYLFGTGAMLAKSLRLGEQGALQLLLLFAWRWAFGRPPVRVGAPEHPRRWIRVVSFVRGFAAGLLMPIDRSTGHYRARSSGAR